MLEIKALSAGYPGHPVLKDLTMQVPRGTVTVISGPNGCGKSTLLKAIAGLLPASGAVLLSGETLSGLSPRHRAQRVAFLPQSRQIPELTVRRLVLHGRFPYLRYPRQYRPADHAAAEEAMATLGISDLADRPLASISGGQRQKAYLAMALAQDTQVVLLDEPTTYLDIAHQLQLMTLARKLADKGKTVILVLHDLPLAMEYADRIVLMEAGTLRIQGTPEEVLQSGRIGQVFGVEIGRTEVNGRWKYYYF